MILIVGGGPAGINAALQARELGASVTFRGLRVEEIAELPFAFPTFTEAVSMAAQKICREIRLGRFPQVWGNEQ